MKLLILVAFQLILITSTFSQVSLVTPERPSITDTVSIVYRPGDSAAALNKSEPIYARVTIQFRDGDYRKFHIALAGEEKVLIGKFSLPALAASFSVDFYTLNKADEAASRYRLVYDKMMGIPVEGAYLNAIFFEKCDSLFALETGYHPHNYLAYAHLFSTTNYFHGDSAGMDEISRLLKKLKGIRKIENEAMPGWYAALCVGNAETGNLTEAKTGLLQLLQRFPAKKETDFAFNIYSYESYKAGNKVLENDFKTILKSIIIRHPETLLAATAYSFFSGDTTIPLTAFEEVFRQKANRGQLEYDEMAKLPELYIDRRVKLDTAEAMLWRAIDEFQTGSVNHEYLLKNHHYQEYVPQMYLDLARIAVLKGHWQQSITLSSAGNNLVSGSNFEGNLRPHLVGLRATAYRKIGNLNEAMLDYETLYKMGETSCLDSMREVFPLADLKAQRFDQFVSSLRPKANQQDSGYSDPAPGLSATDLSGKSVRLADFKGKVVVLNAWGIGCGPCVAEMPLLNQLVDQNKSNTGVVFLGVAGDQTESLTKFLKIHKFDYRVLNNAQQLLVSLNLGNLPTHIVIGKNGQIVSRSVGAREDIKIYLQQIIDNSL